MVLYRALCGELSALASSLFYCMRRKPGTPVRPAHAGQILGRRGRQGLAGSSRREAGIPPVPLLLEARRTAFAARLKALDEAHPLVKRTSRPRAPAITTNSSIKLKYRNPPQPFRTRLRRTDEMLPSCPPELALSRPLLHHGLCSIMASAPSWPLLHHLLAARTGHGDSADYHDTFDHQDARLTCSCGRRKDPNYIFYCRKVARRRRLRLAASPAEAMNRAIGKDFDKFAKLAKTSSFFGGIRLR